MGTHESHRVRHPVVIRSLHVLRVERLTLHMQRIVFGGSELDGFLSSSPEDHVKLFFPNSKGQLVPPKMGPDGPIYPTDREPSPMRDYTPREYDAERGELTIDFVLHGDGPASTWAAQAKAGQSLVIAGPRGSFIVADDFDHYVLIGDETALPAMGRWLEVMPANATVTLLAEIPDRADRQSLRSNAHFDVQWLERQGADAATSNLLETALRRLPIPAGDTFYWIATESQRARHLRQYLSDERGVPKDWLKASGYWQRDGDESEGE